MLEYNFKKYLATELGGALARRSKEMYLTSKTN
jgi:hypothetical protein